MNSTWQRDAFRRQRSNAPIPSGTSCQRLEAGAVAPAIVASGSQLAVWSRRCSSVARITFPLFMRLIRFPGNLGRFPATVGAPCVGLESGETDNVSREPYYAARRVRCVSGRDFCAWIHHLIQSEALGLGQRLLNGGAMPAYAATRRALAHGLQLRSDRCNVRPGAAALMPATRRIADVRRPAAGRDSPISADHAIKDPPQAAKSFFGDERPSDNGHRHKPRLRPAHCIVSKGQLQPRN
jgi:hypothetical protein